MYSPVGSSCPTKTSGGSEGKAPAAALAGPAMTTAEVPIAIAAASPATERVIHPFRRRGARAFFM
ncbi:hypothetical protein CCE02nite_00130 [Cellulosimicrobium cellulans]|uniref:Uncharacterized protein n=1 Tax=Cellulosimicrobium cellulans TaxID=1710 RepID=A0A4Y4DW62_CELCE|nr:hypothetical protein CCE02nite_00130 [Cellulosimicrobium cellulans]